MAGTSIFDEVHALEAAGFDRKQAEAIVCVRSNVSYHPETVQRSKADLPLLKTDLVNELALLKTDLTEFRTGLLLRLWIMGAVIVVAFSISLVTMNPFA